MGMLLNLMNQSARDGASSLLSTKPSNLLEELERYREKAEYLVRIRELHNHVGAKLDLASMIDAFSVWLGQHVQHMLLGYRNIIRERTHISCSNHGPEKNRLIELAQGLLNLPMSRRDDGHLIRCGSLEDVDLNYLMLSTDETEGSERILLFYQCDGINEALCPEDMLSMAIMELQGPLERAQAYDELYNQARRDSLTGLVNRRVFEERLLQEISKAERYSHPVVLACLDLDHFKAINDKLGHAEGDEALRKVSHALQEMVRDSDLLARVGGDEFALILSETSEQEAYTLLERLCQRVLDLDIKAPDSPALGVSIGLSCWRSGTNMETWMEQADSALYRSKSAGRSMVSIYKNSLQ